MLPGSQTYYFVFLAATTAFGIVFVALHKLLEPLIVRKKRAVFVSAAIATIGGVVVFLAPWTGPLVVPLTVAGVVAISVNFLILTFAWGLSAAQGKPKASLLAVTLSFIASYCISLLMLLPHPVPTVVALVSPLLSGMIWLARPSQAKVAFAAVSRDSIRALPLGLIAVLISFLLVGGFMRGFVYSGDINYVPRGDSLLPHFVSMTFAFMMFLIVLLSKQRERLFYSIWIILATLFFAGLFSVALLNEEWAEVASGVLISGRTCLGFFLWITLANASRAHRLSPVVLLGCFFVLTEMLAACLSYFVVPMLSRYLSVPFDSCISYFSVGMALMLIVASFLLLSSKAFRDNEQMCESDTQMVRSDDSWQRACVRIADRCGLTNRETEVMLLVSRGNSKNKIADILFVSSGTIQTHTKSIYRKLDLHSRQDLIDLVSREIDGERRTADSLEGSVPW